jgi:hypothetical protein
MEESMDLKRSIGALALIGGLVLGSAPAVATQPAASVATAAKKAPVSMSSTYAHSIPRVKHEAKKPAVRKAITKRQRNLRALAVRYKTSYAFERDIYVCELTYRPLAKPGSKAYALDPTADALSSCINLTIRQHKMFD